MTLIDMYEYLGDIAGNSIKISSGRTVHIGEVEPDRIKVQVRDSDNLPIKSYCYTTQYIIETPKDLSENGVRETRVNAEQLIREIRECY